MVNEETRELLVLFQKGAFPSCIAQAKTVVIREPNNAVAWKVLGAALKRIGQTRAALVPMAKAAQLLPNDAEAFSNLGVTLRDLGRFDDSLKCHLRAIKISPDMPQPYSNLANTFNDQSRGVEAEQAARRAISLKPDYAKAYNNLGTALRLQNRLTDAIAAYKRSIELDATLPEVMSNLGETLKDAGRLQEAEKYFKAALDCNPEFLPALSNLLFSLNYRDTVDSRYAVARAQKYGAIVDRLARDAPLLQTANPMPLRREGQRLHVGFVSGDLRNHPVGYFFEGLITHLDKARFHTTAFNTTPKEDNTTVRLRAHFDEWIAIHDKTNVEAADSIRSRQIDILIDLSGHTGQNRLPVFAYRPAPVQCTWLGYFATTGVSAIDYIIGDPHVTPLTEQDNFVEKIWQLPETYLCFTPPDPSPEVSPLPALQSGTPFTFGCFNNLAKVNDRVLCTWARVLHGRPDARLFLKSKQLSDPQFADVFLDRLTDFGIAPQRVLLEGHTSREDYLKAYRRVDMALDPFPFPGGTTAVEGLWMGVPVITMKGSRFIEHNGETIAHNLGQSSWIAEHEDDYVAKALAYASDLTALASLRAVLRPRLLASPLMDAPRFAQQFAKALIDMWDRKGSPPRS